ncbi:MAG: DUF3291 domain-containing protein [Pseudomonadota bacterium]
MIIHPPEPTWHLAEVNVALLKAPMGDPLVAPFVNALDRVNAVAEAADGFLWRHIDGETDPLSAPISSDEKVIFNASVWRDAASLEQFVWKTVHVRFFQERARWFDVFAGMHFAMWWVPPGTTFTPAEAMDRLQHLQDHGPSETAFGWVEAPGAQLWRDGRGTG